MNKRNWTKEEDNYIVENFGKTTFSEMAKELNCAIGTVQHRVIELDLQYEKKTARRWTEEEINLLKIMAPKYLNKTIAKKLNRSINELNKKARELGIELIFKRPVWKKWKVKFLKENINKLSLRKIMKELEVNYFQIMDKLDELGIQYESKHWTEEEEKILKELSDKVYIKEIAKVLNRTEAAISTKAIKMGLDYITTERKYTEEELNYIKDNWGKIPVTDIARKIGVSRIMIQNQADKMLLPKLGNNPYREWTEERIDKLKKLAKEKSITELAKYFKTTNDAITTVAYKYGIILNDDKIHWTEEDNKILKVLAKTLDLQEIAKKMDRNTAAVRLQAKRLNIKIIPNKKHSKSVWTEENSKTLKQLTLEGKTLLEICNIMDKKDVTVLKKAKEQNLEIIQEEPKEWTTEEKEKLKELSKTKNIDEIVKELNRTSTSIQAMAKTLNIKLKSTRKNWTEEEYKLLEKLVMKDKKTPKEIAEMLDRTEDSVIIKINRRGLKIQTNDKRYWKKEEEELLQDLWGTVSYETLEKKLNRTVSSIKNKAFQLGLGSQMESNYEGLTIKEISELLNINIQTVSVSWIGLGLKYKLHKISKSKSYRYVEIKDFIDE